MPVNRTPPPAWPMPRAPLVGPAEVNQHLRKFGETPGPVSDAQAAIYDRYAALLACFTPRPNPYRGAHGATHDLLISPNHYSLKHRLQDRSGDYLTENEAKAVGRALGIVDPWVTAAEGRWI